MFKKYVVVARVLESMSLKGIDMLVQYFRSYLYSSPIHRESLAVG
jgi:hypothetical protein